MKKILAFVSCLFVLLICACSSKIKGTEIYKEKIEGNIAYRYTPSTFEFNGGLTPLIVVVSSKELNDENVESVLDRGFKSIADVEKCSVIFINSDENTLLSVLGNTSEVWLPGVDYSKGIDSSGKYLASHFRKYIFTFGDEARTLLEELNDKNAEYYIKEWSTYSGGLSSGEAYLDENATEIDIYDAFVFIKNQTRTYLDNHISYVDNFTYYEGKDYKDNGVEYTIYNESENENRPLVVLFNGRGSNPKGYIAQTGWLSLARSKEFTVMSVTGPYDLFYSKNVSKSLTKKTHEVIMNYVEDNNIDSSKVYLTGFSMGAYRVLALGSIYSSSYKAIAPCNFVTGKNIKFTEKVPAFIMFGETDFYNNMPNLNNWCGPLLENLGKVNGFSYSCERELDNLWGYDFSNVNTKTVETEVSTLTLYKMNDITIFASASNLSHNVLPFATDEIWEFFESLN